MINRVILVGRVGKDAILKHTQSGHAVTHFSLATDRKMGQGQKVTQWHSVTAWRQLAEICGQYVRKGGLLYVEGELSYREADGVKYTDIVAQEIRLLGDRPGTSADSGYGYARAPAEPVPAPMAMPAQGQLPIGERIAGPSYGGGFDESDIPF